jgi:hypothetical protein
MVRRRRPLILASVVAVFAFSLLAAGCGGGGSPGVASVASSTTAATTTTQNGLVAYSACMRSNGVPKFPDPASSGGIPKQAVVSAFQAVSSSQAEAAQNSCRYALPAGGSLSGQASQPVVTAQQRQDYLKVAVCMRSHGFPDFPDPTFQNNSVQTNIPSSIDTNTSKFKSAAATCTKLIPAGLPYSSRSAP